MKQKSVGQAFGSVLKFNEIAGQLSNPDKDSIALQLDLIQEEYLETVEAFDELNRVGVLDGALDMWVVVSGLLQKLEAMGYNVEEGLKRVTDNNLTKFPEIGFTQEYVPDNHSQTFNKKHKVYVLKNENGKVKKPHGFKPVSLSDLVPVVI